MARLVKTSMAEVGVAPDAYLFRGEKKSEHVLMRLIDYDSENLSELNIDSLAQSAKYEQTKSTTWLNIDGLHDEKLMQEIASTFHLESLILAEVMNTNSRPKFQDYDNCLYLSLKMLDYNEDKKKISSENLVLLIKENILITFQEKEGKFFEPIRERIRKNRKRIRTSGPDYLAFALADIVIDNYNYIIGKLGENIESLDEIVMLNQQPTILKKINSYKKEIIFLHKNLNPCREMILDMLKSDSELLQDNLTIHLEELKGNINHAVESTDSYREILMDQINIYHITVSNKLNDIMKFLTVFSVIFIPLTFIVGVYGTNFDYLPELHYKYGYFMMLAFMLLLSLGMIGYFKKKKWF